MSSALKTGNGLLLGLLGTLGAAASLWLPWLNFTAEARMKQGGLPNVDLSALGGRLKPFEKMQRGLDGVVAIGPEVPTWVFIGLAAVIGVISLLRISRILPTSVWISHLLLLATSGVLIYWVASSMSDGAKLQVGAIVALLGIALIFAGNALTGKAKG